MSLWTPYRDEPLDLSRKEVPSPSTAVPKLTQLQYGYPYPYPYPCYPPFYEQPQVRLMQISPSSTVDSGTHSPAASISPGLESFNVENLEENEEFKVFERDALQAVAERNGGSVLGSNPRMRRAVQTSSVADGTYRQQREKNNAAAKQSRDRRKLREFRLSLEVAFLKKKMGQLKQKLATRTCGRCKYPCIC